MFELALFVIKSITDIPHTHTRKVADLPGCQTKAARRAALLTAELASILIGRHADMRTNTGTQTREHIKAHI